MSFCASLNAFLVRGPRRPWTALQRSSRVPWRRSRLEHERAAAFGWRLRLMREAVELTQQDLAGQAGVALDLCRRLESGDVIALRMVTVDLLWRITEALNSDPREFFRGLDSTAPFGAERGGSL